jgi:hypothetical protein
MEHCLKYRITRTDTACPVCGEQALPSWALAQALSDTLEDIQKAFSSPQPAPTVDRKFTSGFGLSAYG